MWGMCSTHHTAAEGGGTATEDTSREGALAGWEVGGARDGKVCKCKKGQLDLEGEVEGIGV